MTSKTLSINLLKGEMKRKLWLYVVSLLYLTLTGPMLLLIKIDNLLLWSGYNTREQLIRDIAPSLSSHNQSTALSCIILASAYAFAIFGYLYNRSAVDLIHSLAVSRKELFKTYMSAVAIPSLALFVIDTVLKLSVLAVKGLINGFIVSVTLSTLVYELAYFMLIFLIIIVAIFITGNFFMGVVGGIGLLALPVVVADTFSYYINYCFQTYRDINLKFDYLTYTLSPVLQFSYNEQMLADNVPRLLITLTEIVLLMVAASYLYRIRPSECTHQALCYKILGPVIRIPAVIIAALLGGIYVVFVSANLPAKWYIVSFLSIGVITHILINSIIKGDVKKSLKDWPQLLISLAVAGAIASIYLFDLTGFDTRIPDKDKVESAGIALSQINDSISNYELTENGDDYSLNYVYFIEYRLSHMDATDIDPIYKLAELGINEIDTRSVFDRHKPTEEPALYGTAIDAKVAAYGPSPEEEEAKLSFVVKFHLKNGHDMIRGYEIPVSSMQPMIEDIVNSKDYKDSICQLPEYIEKKPFGQVKGTDRFYEECFSLEGDDIYAFIDAVNKDFHNMTFDELVNEDPIVSFSSFDKHGNYLDGLSGYYIYPGSVNAIGFLASKGITLNTERDVFDSSRIQAIDVEKYYENGSAHATYSPEADKDIVEAIHSVMVIDSFTYDNSILKNYDYNISLTCNYLTDSGYIRSYSVRVPKNSLPGRVYDDVSEDKVQ